ncbi:MAG: hypothetical protein Fur0042_22540 [Cyanophyceae cyanobacterium]
MGKLNRTSIIGLGRRTARGRGVLFGPLAHRWWFRWANRAQVQGRLDLAIARFERSLGIHPNASPQTAYIHRRLAELHRLRHDWPAMEIHCRRWCAMEPTCGTAHRQLAVSLTEQKRWEAALQAYDAALALGEPVGGAIARIGEQMIAAQRWPLAATAFALALRGDLTCYGWHRAQITAWFEAADWPKAIAAAQTLAGSSLPLGQRAEGYYWLGRIEAKQQNWHRAIAATRLALTAGHRSPWTWIHLAQALGKVAQWPEAVRAYRQAIGPEAGRQLPQRIYQEAIAATEILGDWPALAWLCRTARDRLPPSTSIRFELPLAKALERLGDTTGAIAAYRRALGHQPSPWLWAQLARLLIRIGDGDGAKGAYQTAIAAADSAQFPWANAEFYETWANAWASKRQWDLAIAALRRAIAALENPADATKTDIPSQNQAQRGTLLLTLSQWLTQHGDSGDSADAVDAATEAAALLPQDTAANLWAANLLATAGRWREAAPLYWHHATGTTPLALETWNLAIAAFVNLQQPAAAIVIARQATLQHPSDSTLPHQLGQLLTQLQRPTEAIAAYQRAIANAHAAQAPHTAATWQLTLAELHLTQGQGDRAAALYQQAAAALDEPLPLIHYRHWGKALEQQQDWEAAAACYRQGLAKLPPSRQGAHLDWELGRALERLNRPAEAAEAYQRAIARTPHVPPWVYQNWTQALTKAGDLQGAIAALRQSLQRNAQNGYLWAQLGHLLLHRGDQPAAIAALWHAVALEPHHATAAKTLLKYLPKTDPAAIAIALQRHLAALEPAPPTPNP